MISPSVRSLSIGFGIALAAVAAAAYWCGRASALPCAAPEPDEPVTECGGTNSVENAENGFTTYVVQEGDDLYSLAIKFGLTASELKVFSNLDSDVLTDGQTLRVPQESSVEDKAAVPSAQQPVAGSAPKPPPKKKADPEPAVTYFGCDEFDGEVRLEFNYAPDVAKARDFIRFEPAAKDFTVSRSYWDRRRLEVRINDDSLRGTNVVVVVKPGLPLDKGRTLKAEYRRTFEFLDALPSVQYASDGRYLPPVGACAVEVKAINVKELEYTIARVPAHNIVQLLAREEGNYGSWYGRVEGDDTLELAQKPVERKIAVSARHNESTGVRVPLRDADGKVVCGTHLLSVKVADKLPDDCSWRESQSRRPVYRLVCTTDIGLSARRADGWIYAWTTSLSTGYPESGIKVEVYASNGDLLASDVSGADGLAACELPKEHEPFAVVASREDGSDSAFLALSGRMLVDETIAGPGGNRPFVDAAECEAYVWTDRGIYRHGETIMVQAIARTGAGAAPKPFPLTIRLFDPMGREFSKSTGLTDEFGRLTCEKFSVPESMRSGRWTLRATVPCGEDGKDFKAIGFTNVKIEEFVPPKVRVAITEMPEGGILPMKCHGDDCDKAEIAPFAVKVSAEHLFGGPAAGLFADLAYSFEDAPFNPDGWKGWSFGDSASKVAPNFDKVDGVLLGDDGTASFTVAPDCVVTPSAAVKLTVQASVREGGGRPATVMKSAIVHVRQFYVGSDIGDSVARKDGGAKRKVALVRWDGTRLAERRKLEVKFERVDCNYTCVRTDDGFYTWKCEKLQSPLSKTTVVTDENGEAEITCPADGWGEVFVRVLEPETGAAFATTYWVEWSEGGDDVLRAPMSDPTALSLSFDKKTYRPGDVPVLTVKSPFAGRAWIAGMRNGVVMNKVVTLTNLTSAVQLDALEEDWSPGVDVAVTVVQAVKAGAKKRASRARGASHLKITPADRVLEVKVSPSSEYVPGKGSTLKAEITATGEVEPGAVATVTAVDEGINIFTGQPDPDPAAWFAETRYAHHPLYDIYNRLLPVLDDQLKANGAKTGGGADAGMFARVSPVPTRRFKPLSKWQRDVKLEGGKANVEFDLGEFTGEIRVTAVAANAKGTGAGSARQKVSPKLVAQPDAPRFAAPGDTVTLTYTLNNRGGEDCEAQYSLTAPGTNFAGAVALAKDASKTLEFEVKIGDKPGEAKLTYVSKAFGEEHTEDILLPVRPAVAWEKTGETVVIAAGQERTFELPEDDMFRDASERTFTVYGSPLAELSAALSSLAHYPYGCLEQTTSQVFPLVAAGGILNKLDVERTTVAADAKDAVGAGIARIASMMTSEGFSMWPDSRVATWDDEVPVYASHFIAEASKAGFAVPDDVLWRVKELCRGWGNGSNKARAASACLVLAISGEPKKQWMYDLYEARSALLGVGRSRLARAFALAGERGMAAKLLADATPSGNAVTISETLMALCELDASDPRIPGFVAALLKLRDPKAGHWLTTSENAHALIALGTYYRIAGIGTGKADCVLVDGSAEKKLENGKRVEKRGAGVVKVVNKGDAPAYLAVETRRLPDPAKAPVVSNGMTVETEVCRATGKREKVDPSSLRRGDNALLVVRLSLKNACTTSDFVVDIPLPACFEPGSAHYAWVHSEKYELRREARDDRVVIFTCPYDAKAGETLEFLVPVSVVTAGEFAFPGASAEAMYIPELNARGASSRMTIAK